MRLLVHHQLIPVVLHPKSISFGQICYKRSQGIVVTHYIVFFFRRQKTKT